MYPICTFSQESAEKCKPYEKVHQKEMDMHPGSGRATPR